MDARINGDLYKNNGRVTTCYNPQGLLGNGRWRWQDREEFVEMVKVHKGTIIN